MRIVIVDNLTETFKGEIVQSGLQKSSKLDARAFSAMGYDTTVLGVLNSNFHKLRRAN